MLLERVVSACSYPQRVLLQKLYRLLQDEHLARLAMANVSSSQVQFVVERIILFIFQVDHEPIKRRLHTDKTARQYRKAMADIKWVRVIFVCSSVVVMVIGIW